MKSPQAKVFIMFIAAFAMALASCSNNYTETSSNDGKSLPTSDSIYTSEYINKICRTKPQEALDILDEAEKTQKMRTVKINVLRTMIYIDAYYDTNKGGVSVTFDTPPLFSFHASRICSVTSPHRFIVMRMRAYSNMRHVAAGVTVNVNSPKLLACC